MPLLGLLKGASGELMVAAGCTVVAWLAFAGLFPNERLDAAETALLLVLFFAAAKAVTFALRRLRSRSGTTGS